MAIVEFKWNRALSIYDSIFSVFPKRHNRDLYNASLCALLSNKHQRAQALIREQIARGITIKKLNADVFKQQAPEFWIPIERCYDSLRNVFEAESKRWEWFKTELESIEQKEQEAINDEHLSLSGYHNLIYANAQCLYHLIDSAGVPPIALFEKGQILPVGVLKRHFKFFSQLRRGDLDTNIQPYKDMKMYRYYLEPLLRKSVLNGDLQPDLAYFYVNDFRQSLQDCAYDIKIDFNTRIVRTVENKHVNIDNENKKLKQYCLPSLSDALKKDIDMLLYYNQEYFPFDAYINADKELGYTTTNYNAIQDFKAKKKLIEKRMEVHYNVKSNHMNNLSRYRLPNSETINFHSLLVLKDFKLTSCQGLYIVSEMPLK